MSEIDIESVRRNVVQLRDNALPHPRKTERAESILSALDQLAKENERLTKERDEAMGMLRWAHDTLYEINPSNYDHDEVCRLNNASVEVILGIAPLLGEKHGKADAWWHSRIERQRDQLAAATAESDACWKNLVEAGRQRDTLRTKHAAMQEAIVEAVRRAGNSSAMDWCVEPLRPHLPTPEPEPVDPLVEAVRGIFAGLVPEIPTPDGDELPADAMTRAFLEAAEKYGIELRKVGEGRGTPMIIDVECPTCHGAGDIEVSWQAAKRCPKCAGSGVVDYDLNEDCDDE